MSFSSEPIKVIVNGEEIQLPLPIIIQEEVTLVSVRSIFEAFGAQVLWNDSDQSIVVKKDQKCIYLQVNSRNAIIGEKEILLDAPIKIVNGNAIMPLNLISEVFPVKVEIDDVNHIIKINNTPYGLLLTAKSNILVESKSGLILLEHNQHEKLKVGNIGKIMNLLLIFEAIENKTISLEDIVTVSQQAAATGGSQIFLETGEKQSVETLIKSIVMIGANDSAVAMAEYIAGSEAEFIDLMNKKARSLGMKDTFFTNVIGLDEEKQFTSAYDVAIMVRQLIMKHPQILEFTSKEKETIIRKTKQTEQLPLDLWNHNKLLKCYPGTTGLISGYTAQAKQCFVGTAKRDGSQLIAVTFGVSESTTRYEETMALLDYGFKNFKVLQ